MDKMRWLKVSKPRGGNLPPEAIMINITPAEQPVYAVLQQDISHPDSSNKIWANIPIVEAE